MQNLEKGIKNLIPYTCGVHLIKCFPVQYFIFYVHLKKQIPIIRCESCTGHVKRTSSGWKSDSSKISLLSLNHGRLDKFHLRLLWTVTAFPQAGKCDCGSLSRSNSIGSGDMTELPPW